MVMHIKRSLILLFCVYLTGCVAGHKYNYEESSIDFPVKPSENKTLILSVEDWRPYILSGNKEPSFVGLQRGGFGEPWDVTTSSGKPMTEDMSTAIVSGLKDAGYNVFNISGRNEGVYLVKAANKNAASRIVVLKVLGWKSDVFTSVSLNCDLHLSVLDADGNLLAESNVKSMEKITGGSWATRDGNSRTLAEEFSKKVINLFNAEGVRRALQ